MNITTNWNNIKNKLEHAKYISDKYYKKKSKITTKSNNSNIKLKYFTTLVDPSPSEELIIQALNKYKINYIREVSFNGFKTPNGGYYRYDFYIPDINLIIEYDGKDYHKNKTSDKIKNTFCKNNKIKIVRLSAVHYYKIEKSIREILMRHNLKSITYDR